jgi:stearoyl-CoA desaturase (Delta-9 desaturase)
MNATAPSPGVTGLVPIAHAEMVPIEHETSERVVRTMVFALPPAALAFGGWLAWGRGLHWQDLIGLGILYTLTGLGITVGHHRLFTHRSFKTGRMLPGAAGRVGLDGGRGAGDRVGCDPSQAPPLL